MPIMPTAYKTAITSGNARVHHVLEIDFPVSETKKWGDYNSGGVCSAVRGFYEPRVSKWGRIPRSVSDTRNALQAMVASVVIRDEDQVFATILGKGERVYNVAARIYSATETTSFADWWPAFSGRLSDFEQSGDMEWTLHLRANDQPMQSEIPRVFVTEADWSNASEDALGQPVPVAGYGLHDSTSSKRAGTSDGALPTLYVDTSGFRYLVGLGWWNVKRVYKNGTLQSSGFSITRVTVNGRLFTLVDFTADQLTATITVDAYGYDTNGDGTGTYILTPADVTKHILDHVIYNKSLESGWTGVWPSVTSICDAALFAALNTALLRRAGGAAYVAATYVSETTTGMDLLNQLAADHELKLFWKNDGSLGVGIDDPSPTAASMYLSDPWMRYPHDFLDASGRPGAPLLREWDSSDLLDGAVVKTSNVINLGRYLQQVEVFDSLPGIGRAEVFSPLTGPASE